MKKHLEPALEPVLQPRRPPTTSSYAAIELKTSKLAMSIAAALTLGAGVHLPAYAQNETSDSSVQEISVTGSRIQRSGMTTPTPVTSVTMEDMETLSPGTLMDSLDQLPQFLNNGTVEEAGTWTTVGGQSTLNLRGVGSNRTLVLLDGRRIVPSNRLSTVDINLFPQALISNTEVVTGGASAAYGSDAITGVTNFIIDSTFTGVSALVQGGTSHEGDGDNYRASVAWGSAINERSHLILSAEGYKANGISNYEGRDWFTNPGYLTFAPGTEPQRIRADYVVPRTYTYGGLIPSGPLSGTQFLAGGPSAPYENGSILDSSAQSGLANGVIQGNHVNPNGDMLNRDTQALAGQERMSLFARYSYDLNATTRASLQAIYARNEVENFKLGYVLNGPWTPTIYQNNAFLPEDLRQQMVNEGIGSFPLAKQVPPSDPLNNSGAPLTTTMASFTAAIDGEMGFGDWVYSAYYQYGVSNRDLELLGFRTDRMYRGIDAVRHPDTNDIVCSSTLIQPDDGCVPINIFGLGNESQAARDWLHDYMWVDAEVKQHAAEFSMNGQLIQGWAGPIYGATGVSYRKDTLDQIGGNAGGSPLPDPPDGPVTNLDANGNPLYRGLPSVYEGYNLIDRAGGVSINGGFDVYEVFAETLVPLARDVTLVQGMDLSLAARYADYEGSGGIWAWKAGIDWQLTDEVRFRLTRSRDIRAGSLSERFDVTATGGTIIDRFDNDNEYTIRTVFGGNPEVDPEYSDTITYGVVYQPNWLDGLSMSVDYYDIKISDAIDQIGLQNIMDECFRVGAFCDQIERAPNGTVDNIFNVYINVAEARTTGTDVEVAYRAPIELFGGDENLNLRLIGSYISESSITPYDSPKLDSAGVASVAAPWNVTLLANYFRGPLSVSWTERWVSSADRNRTWVSGIDVDTNNVPSQRVSNLRVGYDFDRPSGINYNVFAMVNNVFNKNPGDVMGLPGPYSVLGRTYAVGLRMNY